MSGDGNFNVLEWQIFCKRWATLETRSIVQSILGCIEKTKLISSRIWMEIHDYSTNRAYPEKYFPNKNSEDLRLKTKFV